MSEHDRSVTLSDAAAVNEPAARAEPRAVTPYGDPVDPSASLDVSRAVSRSEAELARLAAQATESQRDAKRSHVTAEPAGTSEGVELAQRMRRVEEFAREGHSVRAWAGGEHSGTVVAAVANGVVVHVGRDEYVRVPANVDERSASALLGSHVSIDRGGEIRETARGLERSAR